MLKQGVRSRGSFQSLLKPVIIGSILITPTNAIAAGSSSADTYLNDSNLSQPVISPMTQPTESNQSIGDWTQWGNESLDNVENWVDGGIGEIGQGIGSVVDAITNATSGIGNLVNDLTSVANLVYRVMGLPNQVSGWWEDLLTVATGELDPCTREPNINNAAPITFEPGWCIGVGYPNGGQRTVQNPNTSPNSPYASATDPNNPTETVNSPSMSEIVTQSVGDMGVPIPAEVQASANNLNQYDAFEVNPVVKRHYRRNFLDRAITRLVSESTLSAQGQKSLKDHTDTAMEVAVESQMIAGTGQNLDVTQDVMKYGLVNDAKQTLLLGALVTQSANNRVDSALNNRNLINISRTMDQMAKQQRIERAIYARRLLETSSQLNLF
ncbi:MAG: hypothetical protein QNJ37_08715 [Crocosphaera sp.]|nr:hypothetical protein [Crocosphaera sp.]